MAKSVFYQLYDDPKKATVLAAKADLNGSKCPPGSDNGLNCQWPDCLCDLGKGSGNIEIIYSGFYRF